MTQLTRLEKLLFRLEAQHACLAWAFNEIAARPGIVFELGLGKGRTFDHLRRHLPGRDIYVFERHVDSYADCTPEPRRLIEGEIAATLPAAAQRFRGQVVLAHTDVGSFESDHNRSMAELVSRYLEPALAPEALVLSDLPLTLPHVTRLPLPAGAREERYYMYRHLP